LKKVLKYKVFCRPLAYRLLEIDVGICGAVALTRRKKTPAKGCRRASEVEFFEIFKKSSKTGVA